MPTEAETMAEIETMACRIMRDLHEYSGGRIHRWARLDTISGRLALDDAAVIDLALALAVKRHWVLIRRRRDICLTAEGLRSGLGPARRGTLNGPGFAGGCVV